MTRSTVLLCCALLFGADSLRAQVPATPPKGQKVFGPAVVTEPWERVVLTESVPGSDIPVDIPLLETVDGDQVEFDLSAQLTR